MEGGPTSAIRRRTTLSDHLAVFHSVNLRDLLKVRDVDEINAPRGHTGALTLATVLHTEKATTSSSASASASNGGSSRTLLDAIREDDDGTTGGGSSRWRDLTDRIQLRGSGERSESTSSSDSGSGSQSAGSRSGSTVRVSLMTLMELREREEEADDNIACKVKKSDDGENEEEEEEVVMNVIGKHVCCVCMVREKGAAFIPCGHTFCRICSRELLMSRGNCPLCNANILEVLHIF